jgi:hypothetical protein
MRTGTKHSQRTAKHSRKLHKTRAEQTTPDIKKNTRKTPETNQTTTFAEQKKQRNLAKLISYLKQQEKANL